MRFLLLSIAIAVMASSLVSCSNEAPHDVNLLKNSSFEEVVGDVPASWRILNFRGLPDMKASTYGTTNDDAHDGQRSFWFEADAETERFFLLAQEVNIQGARRVRVSGRIKTEAVGEAGRRYPHANLALTFYDKNRARFDSARFADVATQTQLGTSDGWVQVDDVFRVPPGAATVAVSCVLGLSGKIWFDDVQLEIPTELGWQRHEDEAFTHFYMPGSDYPQGTLEFQLQLYKNYSARLGIPPESWERISYYYYPDTTTMHETMGTSRDIYVDYGNREIHSVNPADNHEIIHLLTHPYGLPPKAIAEGTAYYLIGSYEGQPIQPTAQKLRLENRMPLLEQILNPVLQSRMPAELFIPTAASFVGYLIEFGGTEKFLALHRELNNDVGYEGFAQAFKAVYEGDAKEAETVWREVLRTADFSKTAPAGDSPPQE